MPARMKQRRQLSSRSVSSRDIASFAGIAFETAQCEVTRNRQAAMLSGDNVIDLEWSHIELLK